MQRLRDQGRTAIQSNERFEKKLKPIAKELGCEERLYPCDVTKPEEIKALKGSLERDFGEIDFMSTSIAFAPKRRGPKVGRI